MNETTSDVRAQHLAAAEGAVLRADDLIAGYLPGVNILNGADLYCQPGELVGIIGPNGAGKSTLLKALFGLVRIHSGSVKLRGEDITDDRADALVTKGLGFVPQSDNVFPSLTIAENLQMGCYQAPRKFAERFDFVAGLFPALRDRRNQRAGSLSGGERQMVAMGRALMMEPSVLLLDEPSAGLNRDAREDLARFILRIQHEARIPILWVEHDMQMVADLADRLYVLDHGRYLVDGTPHEVLSHPDVVRAYLGGGPMPTGEPAGARCAAAIG